MVGFGCLTNLLTSSVWVTRGNLRFAWTQNGEQFATATPQGVYRREGSIFKIYSLDMVSDGVINIVSGEADFVAKTMTFKVSQLK